MKIVRSAEVLELVYFLQDHFDYETLVEKEATNP